MKRRSGEGEEWVGEGKSRPSSELDLAGGEGLVLHDYGAAGCQDHDVEVLLPLVGLLVPIPGHVRVVGRDQGHLQLEGKQRGSVTGAGTGGSAAYPEPSYLQVGAPLSFPVQQRVQNPAARLTATTVVPTHHIVRRPHPPKKLLVHVLGTAVIGHIGQVHIHR